MSILTILTSLNLISIFFVFLYFIMEVKKIRAVLSQIVNNKKDEINLVNRLMLNLVTKEDMKKYQNKIDEQYNFVVKNQDTENKTKNWESLQKAFNKKGEE